MSGRSRRSYLLGLLLVLVCLYIAGCGFKTQEVFARMSTQGTLHGTVTASPVCPVETPDDTCRPKPLANRQVQIKGPDGKVVVMTTDQQGQFTALLAPGRYLVEVQGLNYPARPRLLQTAVAVAVGQTTEINISVDTGIR